MLINVVIRVLGKLSKHATWKFFLKSGAIFSSATGKANCPQIRLVFWFHISQVQVNNIANAIKRANKNKIKCSKNKIK